MDIEKSAEDYKQEGNNLYKAGNYQKALQLYTKAINKNPKEHSYYSNRALCHFNLKNYQ